MKNKLLVFVAIVLIALAQLACSDTVSNGVALIEQGQETVILACPAGTHEYHGPFGVICQAN